MELVSIALNGETGVGPLDDKVDAESPGWILRSYAISTLCQGQEDALFEDAVKGLVRPIWLYALEVSRLGKGLRAAEEIEVLPTEISGRKLIDPRAVEDPDLIACPTCRDIHPLLIRPFRKCTDASWPVIRFGRDDEAHEDHIALVTLKGSRAGDQHMPTLKLGCSEPIHQEVSDVPVLCPAEHRDHAQTLALVRGIGATLLNCLYELFGLGLIYLSSRRASRSRVSDIGRSQRLESIQPILSDW